MPGCSGDGLDIMLTSMIILNFNFEKLAVLVFERNTPGQFDCYTPVPTPVAL